MNKYLGYIIVFMFLALPMTVFAQAYNDYDAKVMYEVDSSIWESKSLSAERDFIQKKWENNDCGVLMYGSSDVWSELSDEDKAGYTRKDFNSSMLDNSFLNTYEQVFTDMGYNIYSSKIVDYGLQIMRYDGNGVYNGMNFDYLGFVTINNGYMIQWQYFGETDTLCTSRVTNVINSLESTYSYNNNNESLDFNFMGIIVGIIITCISYMGYPFIRVKLMGVKYDSDACKKMAKWNSIIVGGIYLVLTAALQENVTWSAAPAFLYYWINSSVWVNKQLKDFIICDNCGCKVLKKFNKCPKCRKEVK